MCGMPAIWCVSDLVLAVSRILYDGGAWGIKCLVWVRCGLEQGNFSAFVQVCGKCGNVAESVSSILRRWQFWNLVPTIVSYSE